MGVDHRLAGHLVPGLPVFLPHCPTDNSLFDEFLLAWMYYPDRIICYLLPPSFSRIPLTKE
jgi:hypothetical protein